MESKISLFLASLLCTYIQMSVERIVPFSLSLKVSSSPGTIWKALMEDCHVF